MKRLIATALLASLLLIAGCSTSGESVMIIDGTRSVTIYGNGTSGSVTGSNETLIDASECPVAPCDTFIEVMT